MNDKIKAVLLDLERQSSLEKSGKIEMPAEEKMLAISEDTGKFFNLFLKNSKSKRVLEIGTSIGYSTLWFADAVKENDSNKGSVITIEKNPSKIKRARMNFDRAGLLDCIEIIQGNALEILKNLSEKNKIKPNMKFDFVYIDADKENMIQYFELVVPNVRIGGIIAADNMLYPEKFRTHMEKYSEHIKARSNFETVTVPIGNGQEISIKTSE